MERFAAHNAQEIQVENGLGIFVKHKKLYHGTGVEGITELRPAEMTTIGSGLYFTSQKGDAEGYAERRSRRSTEARPMVYSVDIENLTLCDLRNDANVERILPGFLALLQEKRADPTLGWMQQAALDEKIEAIRKGSVTAANLRDAADYGHFSEYIASLGYDGLIAIEGGEGNDIGNHDTYLIFNPQNVHNLQVEEH